MPINVQDGLPARSILEAENIFTMSEQRAKSQQIRPLQILLLNLMPLKQETETQLLRALSNSPLQVDVHLMKASEHVSKNTIRMLSSRPAMSFHCISLQHLRLSRASTMPW